MEIKDLGKTQRLTTLELFDHTRDSQMKTLKVW